MQAASASAWTKEGMAFDNDTKKSFQRGSATKVQPIDDDDKPASTIGGYFEVVSRERLSNDVTNVGVAAALVGGFALEYLNNQNGTVVYVMACLAVHGCTCAALVSALIYRTVNKLADKDVHPWVKRHQMLLHTPIAKFGMGCICYLGIVILNSWSQLAHTQWAQIAALAIGVGSMCSVFVTVLILARDTPAVPNDCH
jgi:hypothetical protein